jgi:type II secretory pathway pseudopilin PulG
MTGRQAGSERGFTYVALIVLLVIIGISLGAAGKYWSNVMLREKEEELLFRGDQYRQAIERYFSAIPGKQQFPATFEELLKDSRTPQGKRHLRQQYKDPITGGDFAVLEDPTTKRIIGVYSPSEQTPLKKANFPDIYKDFEEAAKYSDWRFISQLRMGHTTTPPAAATRPTSTP